MFSRIKNFFRCILNHFSYSVVILFSVIFLVSSFLCRYFNLSLDNFKIATFFINRMPAFDYEKMETIAWDIFSLLFASYFTLLTFSLRDLSIDSYFCFQGRKKTFFPLIISILFLIWVSITVYDVKFEFTNCIIFIFGLLQIVSYFVFLTIGLSSFREPESLKQKFIEILNTIDTKDNQSLLKYLKFYERVLKKIDEGENYSSLFDFAYKNIKSLNLSTIDKLLFSYSTNESFFSKSDQMDNDFLFFDVVLIKNSLEKEPELFEKILKRYLTIYTLWTGKKVLRQSHILVIKDALSNYVLVLNENKSDKSIFYNLYKETFLSCRDIINACLYYKKIELTTTQIDHYNQIIQFLNLHENTDKIIKDFNQHLVEICTMIVALLRIKCLDDADKYLELIDMAFNKHISQISLNYTCFLNYPEILHPTDYYQIKYTYDFYLTLILFYQFYSGKEDDVCDKLKKYKNDGELNLECTIILSRLEEISEDDYFLFKDEEKEKAKEKKDDMKKKIGKIKENVDCRIIGELFAKIDCKCKKAEDDIVEQFEKIGIQYANSEEIDFRIGSNIIIHNESDFSVDYPAFFKPYIFNYFESRAKEIPSTRITYNDFIKNYSENNKTYLFPWNLRFGMNKEKIEGIEDTAEGITYTTQKRTQKFKIDYYSGKNIYCSEDIFSMLTISSLKFTKENVESHLDTCSISVPYEIAFRIDKEKINQIRKYEFTDEVKNDET